MDPLVPLVRVVVVPPAAADRTGPAEGAGADDTRGALARLGGEAQIEIARDTAAVLAAVRASKVDLVLLDRAGRETTMQILGELRSAGPPVVVVTGETGEEGPLEAFRAGAADCVRVGPDYADVLPVVVLEHLRRFRRQRERTVVERRIRDLRRFNENIIQNMNSALLVVDERGVVVTANANAEAILEAAPGSLEGRAVWDWLDGQEGSVSVLRRTIEEGERFRGAEAVVTRDDGRRVPIGISCSPLLFEDETAFEGDAAREGAEPHRGAIVVFQDLSEIVQLQRQVLQTEKMASIGQLAAGVAHEINNPMGFIHANLFQMAEYLGDLRQAWEKVDELQKAVHDGGKGEIKEASEALATVARDLDLNFVQTDFAKAVRESQDGAERIRHIVRDLRDFSHRDTGECVRADVNQCVDSTASIVWTMMKHSVVLEKAYAELPQIRCFPMQLKQVFMNLLVNAYQSIEEKLAGEGGTGEIRVTSELHGDEVVVSILDTGAGIAPENLNRVFDPFFTTKEVGAGTGLGLATCFSIVQRHQGRIEVESTAGEGSTFAVWLPVAGPSPEATPAPVGPAGMAD